MLLRDLRGDPEARRWSLSEDEVEVLVCRFGKGMKPSELTIGQAVLWIGRLGGHLNRNATDDGENCGGYDNCCF